MIKILACIILYVCAMAFIYMGLELAPDMTWPVTEREHAATFLIIIGMFSKLAGHVILLSFGRATARG